MDGAGMITLVSPISKKALVVDGARVEAMSFGVDGEFEDGPDQRVELVNGDLLPVRVEGMDGEVLRVVSPDMGRFTIPRKVVRVLRLGILPERVIFQGAKEKGGWKYDVGGQRNWKIKGGEYRAEGQGVISRDVDLPEKFILRFKLGWDSHPNMRIFFGGKGEANEGRASRYFMQFSEAGFEIRREVVKGENRFLPIALLGRVAGQAGENRLDVELRMDRGSGLMMLYLNGQLEGRYTDPVADIPMGREVVFSSQAPGESKQVVSDVEVAEWDERRDRHRSEERGSGESDSLIGRYGERFGGRLMAVKDEGDVQTYVFQSDFQEAAVELPEEEVSVVFFATKGSEDGGNGEKGYELLLRGLGEMRVSGCEVGKDVVRVMHPLLGVLEIQRAGVMRIRRSDFPRAKAVIDP